MDTWPPPTNALFKTSTREREFQFDSSGQRKLAQVRNTINKARKILEDAPAEREGLEIELERIQGELEAVSDAEPSHDKEIKSLERQIAEKRADLRKSIFGKDSKKEEVAVLESSLDKIHNPFKWFAVAKMGRRNYEVIFQSKDRSGAAVLDSYVYEENKNGLECEFWDKPEIKDEWDNAWRFSSNGFYLRLKNKKEVQGKHVDVESDKARYDLVGPDGSVVLADINYGEATASLKEKAEDYQRELISQFEDKQQKALAEYRDSLIDPSLKNRSREIKNKLAEISRQQETAQEELENANETLVSLLTEPVAVGSKIAYREKGGEREYEVTEVPSDENKHRYKLMTPGSPALFVSKKQLAGALEGGIALLMVQKIVPVAPTPEAAPATSSPEALRIKEYEKVKENCLAALAEAEQLIADRKSGAKSPAEAVIAMRWLHNRIEDIKKKLDTFRDLPAFAQADGEIQKRIKAIDTNWSAVVRGPAQTQAAESTAAPATASASASEAGNLNLENAESEEWTDEDEEKLREVERLLREDIERRRKEELLALPQVMQEIEMHREILAKRKIKTEIAETSQEALRLLEGGHLKEYFRKRIQAHHKDSKNRAGRAEIKKFFDDALKAIKKVNEKYDQELADLEKEDD